MISWHFLSIRAPSPIWERGLGVRFRKRDRSFEGLALALQRVVGYVRAMSSPTSKPAPPRRVWDDERIVTPDEATWERMSPEERDAFEARVLAVLDEYREAMAEGVRQFRAKTGAAADLDGHFRRSGRSVFLACELTVLYPGEPAIVPDVLAVMDCDPNLDLDSWKVLDQGRGIDLVLEVRNRGKKHKDLLENVRDYARLRIPEYFSYDCRTTVLRGWRLVAPGATSYQPIVPQGGYFASGVLGLELAVFGARLRFFASKALIPTADELLARVRAMADQSQQAAIEASEDAARSRASLAGALLRMCERRGLTLSNAQRTAVREETDGERLGRWLDHCLDARSVDDVFSDV